MLASVAEQASLSLTWSETREDTFSHEEAHCYGGLLTRCPLSIVVSSNEPRHDKTNKMSVCPAKTKISLGIRPVWSEFRCALNR